MTMLTQQRLITAEVFYSRVRKKELKFKKSVECLIINALIRKTLQKYGISSIEIKRMNERRPEGVILKFKIENDIDLEKLKKEIKESSSYGIGKVILK